jgi:hypothetical protein
MVPERRYLTRYLHEAAISEIADKYRLQGYEVIKEKRIGKYQVDLMAIRGKEKIIFEFKVGELTSFKKKAILSLHKFLHKKEPTAQFKIINVNSPKRTLVEIEGIEQIILEALQNSMPSDIECLSTHSRIEDISDLEFDSIYVKEGCVTCSGSFIVTVIMQYGSDSDMKNDSGWEFSESFVGTFKLELDENLKIESFEPNIDTSSWNE